MRKQVIHFLICFAAITNALSSCKKDEDAYMPNQYVENENSSEQDDESPGMEILSDEITKMIRGKEGITYEYIQEGIKDSPYIETSVVEDNMLYITLKDGMELQIDLYGVTLETQSEEQIDDSEINMLIEDIQNALKIEEDEGGENQDSNDGIQDSSTETSDIEESNRMNSPQRASVNYPTRVITNNKVLLWAPDGPSNQKILNELTAFCRTHGLALTSLIGDKCTLTDLNTFSSYGLVFIATHGNTRGQLCMPMTDYWIKKCRENIANKARNTGLDNGVTGKVLGFDENGNEKFEYITLSPRFPKLSNTIIWTCVCYVFQYNNQYKSQTLKNAMDADVAGFGGANNEISASTAMKFLNEVGAKFYYKGNGGANLREAYGDWVNYGYDSGVYYMYIPSNTNIIFQKPQVAKSKKNHPVGELTLPAGFNPYRGRKVKSYSQSVLPSQIEAGFCLYNKSTKKSILVPYSTDDNVQTATWNNMITHYVITGNTDNYEAGEYTYKTYLKLGDEIIYSELQYPLVVEKSLCPDNNHPHAIDLGIGMKWACCNVGASFPTAYGGYYAWGELQEKASYEPANYKYIDHEAWGESCGMEFYHYYINIGSNISGSQYDVASMTWGNGWKIPTYDQVRALVSQCKYNWGTINGVRGGFFTGPNGNRIFIPAAGNKGGYSYDAGTTGIYWTSIPHLNESYDTYSGAYVLILDNNTGRSSFVDWRYAGLTIRPIK